VLKELNIKNDKIMSKYRSIRFFERRKLERKMTQLLRKIEQEGEN